MPWIEFDDVGDFLAFQQDNKVSKWPRPDTNRIRCPFRMQLGEGTPFPRPGRFLCMMTSVPGMPEERRYPVIDMIESGVFKLSGKSGTNEEGRTVRLDIVQHLEADFPGSTKPGIEYHFLFEKENNDDFNWTWFWEAGVPPAFQNPVPMLVNRDSIQRDHVIVKDDPDGLDIDWPVDEGADDFLWYPMSECYVFEDTDPVIGMAEFNGVDSWIDLRHSTGSDQGPFFHSVDLRLHGRDVNAIMGFSSQLSSYLTAQERLFWGTVELGTGFLPANNIWFNLRTEFEWSKGLQLTYTVWVDDVQVAERTTNRQNHNTGQLGVRSSGATIDFGHFDMRNLLWKRGTFASPLIELDMPLQVDASDHGPAENHGETFNMALPSGP